MGNDNLGVLVLFLCACAQEQRCFVRENCHSTLNYWMSQGTISTKKRPIEGRQNGKKVEEEEEVGLEIG